MTISFLTDYPAAYVAEKKTLVIADLHIGLEYELYKSGITIPPQGEKFLKTIEKLAKLTKAEKLVILGDIKHKVPGISFREELEIPKMLELLQKKLKIILVIGNHDTEIRNFVPKGVKIYSSRGFKIGKYGFFHGHAWPGKVLMQCDYLFMGHVHPMIQFKDKFGYRIVESIWIMSRIFQNKIKKRYKVKKTGKLEVLIMPAFNRLLGGISVNVKKASDKLIGPLLKNDFVDIDNAKLYLLDGTYLGKFQL